jgi:hypothetical protein
MRDEEHAVEKAKGVVRILVLGDSYMEALPIVFAQSFPRLLEDKLNRARCLPVEVIVAAVSGWGTDDQLFYLRRHGLELRPDLVLVAMTLNNDISDNLKQRFHAWDGERLRSRTIRETPFLAYKIWQVKSYFGAHSHFYQLARHRWHAGSMDRQATELSAGLADLIHREPSERTVKGWEITTELLRAVKETAEEVSARTAILLIPPVIQVNETLLASFLDSHDLSTDSIVLDGPQQRVKAFGEREEVEVVDVLPCFRAWREEHGRDLYFRINGHWNEEAHELAAGIASRALLDHVFGHPLQPEGAQPLPKQGSGCSFALREHDAETAR